MNGTATVLRWPWDRWAAAGAALIQAGIEDCMAARGRCNVMLTGGRAAAELYRAWAALPGFQDLSGVDFYWGDERCVAPADAESNYGLALATLFAAGGSRERHRLWRMEADAEDLDAAAARYDTLLPYNIDLLLLGVGEDGHVASLFPGSPALAEGRRRVVPVVGPKPPPRRLTITPPVIAAAGSIFVLAPGPTKAGVLERLLATAAGPEELPARLVASATWLLEEPNP